MQRYGMVIRIRPEKLDEYIRLHSEPWPDVVQMIKSCNIMNYTIFLKDDLLFGYWEYTGNDFRADMAKMSEDFVTQQWWKLTDACQIPLETRQPGEKWAMMQEVFRVN